MIGSRLSVNYFGKMIEVFITSVSNGAGSSSELDTADTAAGKTITAIMFELCVPAATTTDWPTDVSGPTNVSSESLLASTPTSRKPPSQSADVESCSPDEFGNDLTTLIVISKGRPTLETN